MMVTGEPELVLELVDELDDEVADELVDELLQAAVLSARTTHPAIASDVLTRPFGTIAPLASGPRSG
jgi:hypothetical protein